MGINNVFKVNVDPWKKKWNFPIVKWYAVMCIRSDADILYLVKHVPCWLCAGSTCVTFSTARLWLAPSRQPSTQPGGNMLVLDILYLDSIAHAIIRTT